MWWNGFASSKWTPWCPAELGRFPRKVREEEEEEMSERRIRRWLGRGRGRINGREEEGEVKDKEGGYEKQRGIEGDRREEIGGEEGEGGEEKGYEKTEERDRCIEQVQLTPSSATAAEDEQECLWWNWVIRSSREVVKQPATRKDEAGVLRPCRLCCVYICAVSVHGSIRVCFSLHCRIPVVQPFKSHNSIFFSLVSLTFPNTDPDYVIFFHDESIA